MQLFEHQRAALEATKDLNRVAFYHDMGLGKTYTGAEKMRLLGGRVNLVICQKSKVDDWTAHFINVVHGFEVLDLTTENGYNIFARGGSRETVRVVGVINYDLIFRRPELLKIKFDTIMLDESSMIQNETAKRTKAILKLKTDNVILLSGTPTGGKYEKLYLTPFPDVQATANTVRSANNNLFIIIKL